ncbi:hypothetical protein VW29_03285 [Devosia limi DSM 17137]|uniref:Uncharacterized protein n=1 Tax=Devosia limi DSM 17137 TaxID=1121477 RepID=A0A0F5LVS9_9HYPH|nr:hypothetical protein VW29_03160 [Devosia limi DSM 17137]KKB86274.1 hypothetical protein VW29_03285 [Devosia limi DSM 17137]
MGPLFSLPLVGRAGVGFYASRSEIVRKQRPTHDVIPAKAGIQFSSPPKLDPGLRRGDAAFVGACE